MTSLVRVVVQTFSGEALELDLKPKETVLGLQHKISQHCKVPPICMTLTSGADVLQDTGMQLVDLIVDDTSPLVLTLVISNESLHRKALSGSPKDREMAVDDLLQVANRDYQSSVEVLSTCSCDHILRVRSAATDALGKIARRGDARAIAALCARLTDSHKEVRLAALESLAPLLDWQEDGAAVDVLNVCFAQHHPGSDMRAAAADVIGETAPQGHQQAICILIDCLKDGASRVRRSAVSALAKTTLCGDASAVAAVCECAKDRDWEVRAGAMTTLATLASFRDSNAIEVANELLRDPELKVQSAASAALAWLVDMELDGR